MDNQKTDAKGQERIAAALGALLFPIPLMMHQKTEFTVFYMRQNLVLCATWLAAILIGMFFGALATLLKLIIVLHAWFLAWKAYQWEKYEISYLYPQSFRITKFLGIDRWFTPGK